MTKRPRPTLARERAAGAPDLYVAGVDEVGRGPLAGPVMAAAVVVPGGAAGERLADTLRDSKTLTGPARQVLARSVRGQCLIGFGAASVAEIDRHNILQATFLAMRRALGALPVVTAHALVDGNRVPDGLGCTGEAVIGGDAVCASIAAASIVAKVARDGLMARLAVRHPGYGWERNAGYGTREHRDALVRLGITPHHRRSFAPVAALAARVRTVKRGEDAAILSGSTY